MTEDVNTRGCFALDTLRINASSKVLPLCCFVFFFYRERERIVLFSIAATRQMFNFQLISKTHFSRSAEGVSQKTIIKTNKQACAEGSKSKARLCETVETQACDIDNFYTEYTPRYVHTLTHKSIFRGTQRLFSVKYLFGEANTA